MSPTVIMSPHGHHVNVCAGQERHFCTGNISHICHNTVVEIFFTVILFAVLERGYLSSPPPYRHTPPATLVNNAVIDTLLQKYHSLQGEESLLHLQVGGAGHGGEQFIRGCEVVC